MNIEDKISFCSIFLAPLALLWAGLQVLLLVGIWIKSGRQNVDIEKRLDCYASNAMRLISTGGAIITE